MRELVRRADDEGVEGVAGIQTRRARYGDRRRGAGFQGGRFLRAERDHRGVRVDVRDEINQQIWPFQLDRGLGNAPRVVLRQPVLEKGVRDPDGDRGTVLRNEGRRPEPGIEAVSVHLCFDTGEDLVPEVHFSQYSIFHRFFHRCGKLWRQTKCAWNDYGRTGLRRRQTVAHSQTIDTLSTRSLTLKVRLNTEGE